MADHSRSRSRRKLKPKTIRVEERWDLYPAAPLGWWIAEWRRGRWTEPEPTEAEAIRMAVELREVFDRLIGHDPKRGKR